MKIFIDADGCPVVDITVREALKYGVECTIVCDTSHQIEYEGAQTVIVEKGRDSADFRLVNMISAGDIAVTQDYGLAAMCMSKGAVVLNQNGGEYTSKNIGGLLEVRALSARIRRGSGRLKGPKKRTPEQDKHFESALRAVIERMLAEQKGKS